METKRWKQLLAGILCVTMVSVSTGPVVYAAEENTTNFFLFFESFSDNALKENSDDVKLYLLRVSSVVKKTSGE